MSARLPVPGSDDGEWGDILNNFLTQSHNSDGTLKQLDQAQILNLVNDLAEKVNTADLANVATSGSYHDLSDKPTVPDADSLVANADLDTKTAALINQNLSEVASALRSFVEAMSVIGRVPAGRYIAPPPMVSQQVVTLDYSANRPVGAWLPIWATVPIDRMGLEVTTAGSAGSAITMALYKLRSSADFLDLITSVTGLDGTTTGFKEATQTRTLVPGRYALLVAQLPGATSAIQIRASNGEPLFEAADQADIMERRGGIHITQIGNNVNIISGNAWPVVLPIMPGARSYSPACYLRTA